MAGGSDRALRGPVARRIAALNAARAFMLRRIAALSSRAG